MARVDDRNRDRDGGIAVAYARRRGLEPDRVYAIRMILVIGALVGGRAFYLLEHRRNRGPCRC